MWALPVESGWQPGLSTVTLASSESFSEADWPLAYIVMPLNRLVHSIANLWGRINLWDSGRLSQRELCCVSMWTLAPPGIVV